MFSKSRNTSDSASPSTAGAARGATFSVFGADVVITGDVRASVDLHIDGRVEGDVSCATLVQGTTSSIVGAVIAEQARIGGTVEGSIRVKALTVEQSARIKGDVSYETISMAQGAQIDGRLSHIDDSAPQGLKLISGGE
jgi:cytoskeletal protein CcmA (bactofilin family)